MMRWLRLLLIATFIIPMPNATLRAAFDDQEAGARAAGMTNAFVAVADDADAIAYNPAGLIQLNEGQLTSQYSQAVKGLGDGSTIDDTYVGYAMPLVRGFRSVGFAYHNLKAADLFNERTLTLSYGHRLDLEPYGWRGIYSLGGNVKQLHREYQLDRFTENALNDAGVASNQQDQLFSSGNSKDTYALDLGGLAQFGSKYQYTAGIAATNINQPDVSLGGDGDKAPMALKAGVGYRPKWGTATAELRRIKRLASQTDNDIALGLERNIPMAGLSGLILRGGYASGSRNYKEMTMGLSYLYSRFRLDYAFTFPIAAIPGVAGLHRLGFSFRMGAATTETSKDYTNADLLDAFTYDSLSAHLILTRFAVGRNTPVDYKDHLMLLLLRKYRLDDDGLKHVRGEMRDLMRKYSDFMAWPKLKMMLLSGVPEQDKTEASNALDLLAHNEPRPALMRLALLTPTTQKTDRITGLTLMALSELAAQAYRSDQLDASIDDVRRILELMPQDEIVMRAYRQLLARRIKPPEEIVVPEEPAPATLVAPTPVTPTQKTEAQQKASERDALAQAYGTSLGYYFMRKSAAATYVELRSLLEQMKVTYQGKGVDLSVVERELAELKPEMPAAPAVVVPVAPAAPSTPPAAKPAVPVEVKPTPKPEPVKKSTPKIERIPAPVIKKSVEPEPSTHRIVLPKELERAWRYYQDAAERDITDHEKVEILREILKQFGESGAARVNKELDRIRRRMQ